jgi:xylulokinase
VLEGVAFNSRWLLQSVEKFVRRPLAPIRMIGGGALSDVWCQIHADVFDRPVAQVGSPMLANVRGAAFLAAAGLGFIAFPDIEGAVQIIRTYQPIAEHTRIYDNMFKEFKDAYKKTRKICARLNR